MDTKDTTSYLKKVAAQIQAATGIKGRGYQRYQKIFDTLLRAREYMGGIHKRMSNHVDIYPLICFLQPVVYLKKKGIFGICGRNFSHSKA